MILIAPHDETQHAWTPPRTLANRTVAIHLDRIAAPRPEAALWSEFEARRQSYTTALCDAVSTALRRIREVDTGNVARFPDAAAWAAAAAPALAIDERAIVNALTGSIWTGSDPLREAVHAFLDQTGAWTGDATDLLNHLHTLAPDVTLPATPKGISQVLLRIPGIRVTRDRTNRQRAITIAKIGDASQEIETTEAQRTHTTH